VVVGVNGLGKLMLIVVLFGDLLFMVGMWWFGLVVVFGELN